MKFLVSLVLPFLLGGVIFFVSLVIGIFLAMESQRPGIPGSIWLVSALLGLVTFGLIFWVSRKFDRGRGNQCF